MREEYLLRSFRIFKIDSSLMKLIQGRNTFHFGVETWGSQMYMIFFSSTKSCWRLDVAHYTGWKYLNVDQLMLN